MVAPRKDRHLTGSFRANQDPPKLVYAAPLPGALNAEQKALLKARPKSLSQRQKLAYRRAVLEAPWLQLGDREMLVLWTRATDLYRSASTGLDGCLRDPAFANPASAAAKTGAAFHRIVQREASLMISLAHRLGFSPAGRLALGVSTKAPPAVDEADPWAMLRLVPGGRSDDAG